LRLLSDPRLRTLCLVLWAVGWCVVAYQSLRPVQELPFGLSDKWTHFAGYGVMTAFAASFCHAPLLLVLTAAGSVAAGVLLEGVQHLLPHRTFEALDILANTAGACLGTAAALLWVWMLARSRVGDDGGGGDPDAAASPRPS
jgi:VanZ family protein